MTKDALIAEILKKAREDVTNRRDHRFLDTMGFLVAKGLLKTNMPIKLTPSKRIRIDDAVWAGLNAEPRILEVLPAAVLRLGRHFDLDPTKHPDLARTVRRLRRRDEEGEPFMGIPYEKVRQWVDIPLLDRRVKALSAKKVVKTFRISPEAASRLRSMTLSMGCTETAVLEGLVMGAAEARELQ